jgi:hypothetical protein
VNCTPYIRTLATAALLAAHPTLPVAAQAPADIDRARAIVGSLASERLEGRLAGSDGERRAAELIVRELTRIGAQPLPGRADYRRAFEFTAGARDAGSSVALTGQGADRRFADGSTVQALSFTENGSATGPVVFAGYGPWCPTRKA